MREHKFRAWDEDRKEMTTEGGFIQVWGNGDYFVYHEDELEWENNDHIIMQYTGLKDKNGKEYADCDVMQWIQKDYTSLRLERVLWHDGGWWIADAITSEPMMPLTAKEAKLRTIIGNIYENKELLNE